MTYRRKLIEVSLPLEAINKESAREKSIRQGHPSTLHLWWARRPLAACRAVLWSSLVDDPSEYMPDEASANVERERLFKILEDLVLWENVNNEEVLDRARLEIARSVARNLNVDVPIGKEAIREFLATKAPPVLDPFAGGGSIPLEAQRLGLRAYASDLNPVAVLINKALIEIPPKFAGVPPVHLPEEPNTVKGKGKKVAGTLPLWQKEWKGAQGLAEDVRYYGKWMRDEAEKRIGHLYPKVKIIAELLAERPDLKAQGLKPGDELTVIAWLWARTVKCPNPACGAQMPLIRSFIIAAKKGNDIWLQPNIDRSKNVPIISFSVKKGLGKPNEGTVNRNGAHCIACNMPVSFDYIRSEGRSGRIGAQMTAIAADGGKGRIYFSANSEHESLANKARPSWSPDSNLPEKALGFRVQLYGMTRHADLFTLRQLTVLSTLSELIQEVHVKVASHGNNAGLSNSVEYANAVSTYLAFVVDKQADLANSLNRWEPNAQCPRQLFARQAIPIVWDYAEGNPLGESSGSWQVLLDNLMRSFQSTLFDYERNVGGVVRQKDATTPFAEENLMVSTDPPYYDNIGYADLSDFFYVWLRRSLGTIYPELFATLLVPKAQELIATPFRFNGDKQRADTFFENGLRQVFGNVFQSTNAQYPVTVFYAFKQSEGVEGDSDSEEQSELPLDDSRASTGWETMLEGLLTSGFQLTGTWPMRTEMNSRMVGQGTNALASSIVLVCRRRPAGSSTATRREFLAALKKELSPALRQLQKGSIAPVDFAQAAIGPGMAVYSRFSAVLEADGNPMRVRAALALINQALDEYLSEQEGEYDGDTRWALAWFEQFGHNEAPYGVAETLSKAKNTSVNGLAEAGILEARAGKVRLLQRDELDIEWDPEKDKRLTAWESVQHLIHALDRNGEESAAALLARLGSLSETARDLAYRLYTVCERKGWAQDALAYNMLVVAWPRLKELSINSVKQAKLL